MEKSFYRPEKQTRAAVSEARAFKLRANGIAGGCVSLADIFRRQVLQAHNT